MSTLEKDLDDMIAMFALTTSGRLNDLARSLGVRSRVFYMHEPGKLTIIHNDLGSEGTWDTPSEGQFVRLLECMANLSHLAHKTRESFERIRVQHGQR